MAHDLDSPAQLIWHSDTAKEPADWSGAEAFPTLGRALAAAAERLHDAPWIRAGGRTLPPAEVDALWKEKFRDRSD